MTSITDKSLHEVLSEMADVQEKATKQYDQDADKFWNGMSKEDQLLAFYSVIKRMHQAEVVDQRSYRGALYDVYGFGPNAYGVGMECGYMTLHNMICEHLAIEMWLQNPVTK